MPAFVLIHSPLVGPYTWEPVATALTARGHKAVVPELVNAALPFWASHVRAIAEAVDSAARGSAPLLVAHSGAGPLLPAARQAISGPIAGYVFVDAQLPRDGRSRLDMFGAKVEADALRASARGGMLPPWGAGFDEATWQKLIPNAQVRERFRSQLKPTPLLVYEEPLMVFSGWPDAPCAYLHLSDFYSGSATEARNLGWDTRVLAGQHLQMLSEPERVAGVLIDIATAFRAR